MSLTSTERKVIVMGNGPSLLLDDVIEITQTYPVIGTNRILRPAVKGRNWFYPEGFEIVPDAIVVVDKNVFTQEADRINQKKPLLIIEKSLYEKEGKILQSGLPVDVIRLTCNQPTKISKNFRDSFEMAHLNTCFYAMEYAFRLLQGYGSIGFIGCDFKYVDGYPTHFYGDGTKLGAQPHFNEPLSWLGSIVTSGNLDRIKLYNIGRIPSPLDNYTTKISFEDFKKLKN